MLFLYHKRRLQTSDFRPDTSKPELSFPGERTLPGFSGCLTSGTQDVRSQASDLRRGIKGIQGIQECACFMNKDPKGSTFSFPSRIFPFLGFLEFLLFLVV